MTDLNQQDAPVEVTFKSAYEGPSVDAGRMDARVFGPALFSIAGLVERSGLVLYPEKPRLGLEVKANFRKGSFAFELLSTPLDYQGVQVAAGAMLSAWTVSDIDTVLRWLGLVGSAKDSLLGGLARIGGQRVEGVATDHDGSIHVSINVKGDGNVVIFSPEASNLLRDEMVRDLMEDVAKPLSQPGITSFRSGASKGKSLRVPREAFTEALPQVQPEQTLSDGVLETALEVVTPSFDDSYVWRFARGGERFTARVKDERFFSDLSRGLVSFSAGDFLVVKLRTRTFSNGGPLKAEHEVIEVLRHVKRAKQGNLFS